MSAMLRRAALTLMASVRILGPLAAAMIALVVLVAGQGALATSALAVLASPDDRHHQTAHIHEATESTVVVTASSDALSGNEGAGHCPAHTMGGSCCATAACGFACPAIPSSPGNPAVGAPVDGLSARGDEQPFNDRRPAVGTPPPKAA